MICATCITQQFTTIIICEIHRLLALNLMNFISSKYGDLLNFTEYWFYLFVFQEKSRDRSESRREKSPKVERKRRPSSREESPKREVRRKRHDSSGSEPSKHERRKTKEVFIFRSLSPVFTGG